MFRSTLERITIIKATYVSVAASFLPDGRRESDEKVDCGVKLLLGESGRVLATGNGVARA